MYSVLDYGRMAADMVRMDAYQRAILATVRPGATVLDLGAGTGIMSLLALRAGAARVHAVDPNPAVQLIPALAKENGFGDRIVVHQASSLEMDVPEPIDVAISDIRGAVPLIEPNLAALRDVRERWLAPGGVILPKQDRLAVVVVEAEALARSLEDGAASFERFGFTAAASRQSIRNQVYTDSDHPLCASDMLSSSATWAAVDHGESTAKTYEGTVALDAIRGGTARGLAVFFETDLCAGVTYTTAPGHSVVYNRQYLPLLEPVVVAAGDRIEVTVRADAHGERWAWDTALVRAGAVLKKQRQATFLGLPLALAELVRSSETSTPQLGRRGARLRHILGSMDGARTLKQIAASVVAADPTERAADVLELVRSVAMRYGV